MNDPFKAKNASKNESEKPFQAINASKNAREQAIINAMK